MYRYGLSNICNIVHMCVTLLPGPQTGAAG